MRRAFGAYLLSDERGLVDVEAVCSFLGKAYWAAGRTRAAIERSIANSKCFGAYLEGRQVAFARVVTDEAVSYYLCDVWVDEAHRGRGLGTALVAAAVESPALAGLTGFLATKDAHGLYEKFGFATDRETFMRRKPLAGGG